MYYAHCPSVGTQALNTNYCTCACTVVPSVAVLRMETMMTSHPRLHMYDIKLANAAVIEFSVHIYYVECQCTK